MPKVSIVTPCYNAEAFVGRTIESLLRQTFTDWEQVVVDDGSTDGSAEVIRGYAEKDPRVRLVRQENQGMMPARITGMRHCDPASEFYYFLDADDLLTADALALFLEEFQRGDDVALVHCRFFRIDEADTRLGDDAIEVLFQRFRHDGKRIRPLRDPDADTPFASVFLLTWLIPSACMIRRSAFEASPGWDLDFGQGAEDTNLFLHIASRGRVRFLDRELMLYRLHASQLTSRSDRMASQTVKLYDKWAHDPSIPEELRRQARDAWTYYHCCMLAQHQRELGRAFLRNRNYAEGAKSLLRSVTRRLYLVLPLPPLAPKMMRRQMASGRG